MLAPVDRHDAVLAAPMCRLGALFDGDVLTRLDFLLTDVPVQGTDDPRAVRLAAELDAYWSDPDHVFTLPFAAHGTPFRHRVWDALLRIPRGMPTTYGALARTLASAPRAVGQACGDNPLPLIIPCHRVLAAHGPGGFMHSTGTASLDVKGWLLAHESR